MKFGIILNSNDPETIWNAFRLAIVSLDKRNKVRIFLLGKGVEIVSIKNSKFNIARQIATFQEKGGEILACGTCLSFRGKKRLNVCPSSSMQELVQIIEDSDKLITFGG